MNLNIKNHLGHFERKTSYNLIEITIFNLKEPVKSFVGMFRKMKISLYDN